MHRDGLEQTEQGVKRFSPDIKHWYFAVFCGKPVIEV